MRGGISGKLIYMVSREKIESLNRYSPEEIDLAPEGPEVVMLFDLSGKLLVAHPAASMRK